jgi:tagaturonate epimerase
MKRIGKYSMGLGDRFGHQGSAQLRAIIEASYRGIEITPVWNKSNREHNIIGTGPEDVRHEADIVTENKRFNKPYFVDADHITFETVNRFIEHSDFFTIDVSSYIGQKAEEREIVEFMVDAGKYTGNLKLPGSGLSLKITEKQIIRTAEKYLYAAIRAFDIYRKIEKVKGKGNFITEISMDEVPDPQSPAELFFILRMLALENIPVQTIAPRFSGRFLKGVDFVGDPNNFAEEFEADLLITDLAINEFGLPNDLKISIHSGSDKFSLYPLIGAVIKKYDKGIHIKTAGTTWLEEVIGLAESGGDAYEFVKNIYIDSLSRIEELCAPYADVIDIHISSLPSESEITDWTGNQFADAIRHITSNKSFNSNMRQLMHVSYKLAASNLEEFHRLLEAHEQIVGENVFENIFNRHICRLFDLTPLSS